MNQRIASLKEFIRDRKPPQWRRTPEQLGIATLNETFASRGLNDLDRSLEMFRTLLDRELPVILPNEKIVFTRTITSIPDIYTKEEWEGIKKNNYLHERGTLSNLSANFACTLEMGFENRKKEIRARLEQSDLAANNRRFLQVVFEYIVLVQDFIEKYATKAESEGMTDIAITLRAIKTDGAKSFRQALQLLRILHFMLWESGTYHNTMGRFDQYMYPYYRKDIEAGILTGEEAYELVLEFFLICNKDSDLYIGMQQGDNGQSMALGGRSAAGEYLFNDISEMALKASCELAMIDPKINLRVDSQTPLHIFEAGSELTRLGLGFPQYNNDDIVIPGLIRKGYSPEDARDYVVAACWEFIIPGYGMEIPNIDAISFADVVSKSIRKLNNYPDYNSFYASIETEIKRRFDAICEKHKNLYIAPAPWQSLLMNGTIERAKDITEGGKYNNYGIHGTGLATAADSLAAVKRYYFEEKSVGYDELIGALDGNFTEADSLYNLLRHNSPKMGQDDDFVDSIGEAILTSFDRALEGAGNERGGVYRAGTGTAMYYIGHSANLEATADGRKAGEVIPANYSPSLFVKQKGPVSVIKSFTKPDLTKTINGGPLTLEFDDSVFRNEECINKLAMLVKSFITMGGHQLQLNAINRDKLLDAKAHPELYRNLIVRVWGWSGYFVELDEVYQDHIIQRIKFTNCIS
jgi:formate C-acetyltransferase